MTSQIDRLFDFSGGIQNATTWQLRKPNEVEDSINGRYNDVLGAISRRLGYTYKPGIMQANKRGRGLHESKFSTGAIMLGAVNNSGDTETKIKQYDNTANTWTDLTLPDPLDPDTQLNMIDSIGETYVAGSSNSGLIENRMNILNVKADDVTGVITVSKQRNLLNAPTAKFIAEYGGSLYAINVKANGKVYPDRAYKSSPATGVVTYVQGEQIDVDAPVDLIDNVPTMTSNTSPIGVASASSEFNPVTHGAWVAFNDSIEGSGGGWTTNPPTTSAWLAYDFGSGNSKTITYYSLIGSNAGDTVANRAPKTWTFEGSNNGSTWTTLDTQTNVPTWAGNEKRIYSISNTTAYRYYRLNVSANQGATDVLNVKEMELLTSSQGTKDLQLKLDSVRYVKQGMVFDIYQSGQPNKLFTITVNSVDKPNNTITFTPYTLPFATTDVNTSTDVITLSSTTNFPTGTTIRFTSTGTIPAGLTANTIYYAINTSPTTIKVATSLANAKLGVGVDITSQGTGNHTIRLSYAVSDNDELWLTGRYGDLAYLWNTDYPTEQTADYLRIPPGFDSDSEITGCGKSNNRLILFTKNSAHKWDQQNLITFYEDIGCIAHETIQNIGDWLIWLDAEGRVQARNDASGQEELISRTIQNVLRNVPNENLADAAAGKLDNIYKLSLGLVDGSYLRICYDFDSNTWSHETHKRQMFMNVKSDMDGSPSMYFLSDTGYLYRDDYGYTDIGSPSIKDTIPFAVRFGRRNQMVEQLKNYHGVYVYSKNCAGASVRYALDGSTDFKTMGQIRQEVEKIAFSGIAGQSIGRDINLEIAFNTDGESPRVDSLVYYFSQEEDKFGQPTKR